MSRDPQLQQTDVERLMEERDRNGRRLELYYAAAEFLRCADARGRLMEALEAIELERR